MTSLFNRSISEFKVIITNLERTRIQNKFISIHLTHETVTGLKIIMDLDCSISLQL